MCTQDSDCGPEYECILDLEGPAFFKGLWSGDSDDTCDSKPISGGDVLHFIKALAGETYDADASPEDLEALGFCTFPVWKGVENNREDFFVKDKRIDDSSDDITLYNLTSTETSTDGQCDGGFWDGTTCHCFLAFTGTACDTCSSAFSGDNCESCASGHGGETCKPCPTANGQVCGGKGTCSSGREGTGNCVCNDGFHGAACDKIKSSPDENRNRPFSEWATLDCKGSVHLLSSNKLLRAGVGTAFLKDFLKEMKSLTLDTTQCHYVDEAERATADEVKDEYNYDFGTFLHHVERFSSLTTVKGDLQNDPVVLTLGEEVLIDATSARAELYEDEDEQYNILHERGEGRIDLFLNFTVPTAGDYFLELISIKELTLSVVGPDGGEVDFGSEALYVYDQRECDRFEATVQRFRNLEAGMNLQVRVYFSRNYYGQSNPETLQNFVSARMVGNETVSDYDGYYTLGHHRNVTTALPYFFKNGLGSLLHKLSITLPDTCTAARWDAGEPCLFSLPLPAFHTTIRVAVDHCSSNDALPYVSIGCEGIGCEAFMRPCSRHIDCPGSFKCRPLVDNIVKGRSSTYWRDICAKVGYCPNKQQLCPLNSTYLFDQRCPQEYLDDGFMDMQAKIRDSFLKPKMNSFHQDIETFFNDIGVPIDEDMCPDFEFSFNDRTNAGTEVLKIIRNLIFKPTLGGNVKEFSSGQLHFCGIDNVLDGFNFMPEPYREYYDTYERRRGSFDDMFHMIGEMLGSQCNQVGTLHGECRNMLQPWSDGILPGDVNVLSADRKSGAAFTPFLNSIQKSPDASATTTTVLRVSCDSRVSFMAHTGIQMEAYLPRVHFVLHNLMQGLVKKITDCTYTGGNILDALNWASNFNVFDPVFWWRQVTSWTGDDTADVVTDSPFHKIFKDFDSDSFNQLLLPSSCSWERWTSEGVCEVEYDNLEDLFSVSNMSLLLRVTRCPSNGNLYALPDLHLMCLGDGCRQVIEFYKTDLCTEDADCGPDGSCERLLDNTIWKGHLYKSGTAPSKYYAEKYCSPNQEFDQCDNADHSSSSMLHALKMAFDSEYTATSNDQWGFCHPHLWTAINDNLEVWKKNLTSTNSEGQTVVRGLKAFESQCPPCNHGTCTNVVEGNCICDGNWEGESCNVCPSGFYGDSCLACPKANGQVCNGHGSCTSAGGCQCNPGFSGALCENVATCGDGIKSSIEQCDSASETLGCVNCKIQDDYICFTVSSDAGPTSECEEVGSGPASIGFGDSDGEPVSVDLPPKSEQGATVDELESFGIDFPADLLPGGQSVEVQLRSSNPAAAATPPAQQKGTKFKFSTVFFEVTEQAGSTPVFNEPIVFRLQLKGNECDGNYVLLLLNETSNAWESAADTCTGSQYGETLSVTDNGCILTTNVCHLTNFAVGERFVEDAEEEELWEKRLYQIAAAAVVLLMVLTCLCLRCCRKKSEKLVNEEQFELTTEGREGRTH